MKRSRFLIVAALSLALTSCGGEGPKESYEEGIKLYEEKSYDEAAQKLALAIEKNPEKAEYYIAYGMVLLDSQKPGEALEQFDKAILDKENQIVRENNKQAYRGRGIAYFDKKEYENAAKAFGEAYKIRESKELDLDILYYKAEAEERLGAYEEAVKTCGEILKLKKSDASLYVKRAQMEYLLEDTENALKDYDEAIKLAPGNYDSYFAKYFMLKDQGDAEGAEAVLEAALLIGSKTDEEALSVAKIHFFQGQYPTASIELADLLGKGLVEAAFYLGQIYEGQEDYPKAIENYETYIAAEPDKVPAAAYNQLGMCYMNQEEYDKALKAFQSGIALDDGKVLPILLSNEIAALERLEDYKTAKEKAKAYLALYPEDKDMAREADFILSRAEAK